MKWVFITSAIVFIVLLQAARKHGSDSHSIVEVVHGRIIRDPQRLENKTMLRSTGEEVALMTSTVVPEIIPSIRTPQVPTKSVASTKFKTHTEKKKFIVKEQVPKKHKTCIIDKYFPRHKAEFKNKDPGTMSGMKGYYISAENTLLNVVHEFMEDIGTVNVDIGGNKGDFTELLRTKWNGVPVFVFDVIKELVDRMRRRFSRDHTIHVDHKAVSDSSGKIVEILGLPEWKHKTSTGASMLVRTSKFKEVLERVETISLDDWAKTQFPSPNIIFLKIDTEGNDINVLRGARNLLDMKRIQVVFFENNKMQSQIGSSIYKTVEFLAERGYNTYLFGQVQLLKLTGLCKKSSVFSYTTTSNSVAIEAGSDLEKNIVKGYRQQRIHYRI